MLVRGSPSLSHCSVGGTLCSVYIYGCFVLVGELEPTMHLFCTFEDLSESMTHWFCTYFRPARIHDTLRLLLIIDTPKSMIPWFRTCRRTRSYDTTRKNTTRPCGCAILLCLRERCSTDFAIRSQPWVTYVWAVVALYTLASHTYVARWTKQELWC